MQVTDAMVAKALDAYNEALSEITMSGPDTVESLDDIREIGLRAALTAALAEMWRPIEEAPKDGTVILLSQSEDALCGYAPEVKPWKRIAIGRFVGFWQIGVPNGHSCGGADDQFTHWMPLPPPPMGK